ncbi:MAG TPA: heavy metal translocating P-type ATPase, partial [Chloroflexi bacterium]|nr:heavy metal translocating P-type ATPase [Chloroflexota bacterium]
MNFAGARLAVEYAAAETSRDAIARTVSSMGYRLAEEGAAATAPPEGLLRRVLADRQDRLVLLGTVLVVAGLALSLVGAPEQASIAVWAVAAAVAGWPVARKGVATVRA